MTLATFVHNLGQTLLELAGQLEKKDTPCTRLEREEQQLGQDLETACRGLRHWQKDLAATRERISANQTLVSSLTARIESCVRQGDGVLAYQLALELEQRRQQLTEDEAHVPRQELTCWSLQVRIRQLLRQREQLRARIVEAERAAKKAVNQKEHG